MSIPPPPPPPWSSVWLNPLAIPPSYLCAPVPRGFCRACFWPCGPHLAPTLGFVRLGDPSWPEVWQPWDPPAVVVPVVPDLVPLPIPELLTFQLEPPSAAAQPPHIVAAQLLAALDLDLEGPRPPATPPTSEQIRRLRPDYLQQPPAPKRMRVVPSPVIGYLSDQEYTVYYYARYTVWRNF